MKSRILVIILISTLFFAKEEHSFKLKNGSKIIGTIVSENDEIYELDTNMGLIQISKKDIKRFECLFFMNDGNILAGKRVSSSVKITRGIVSSLSGLADNYSNIQINAYKEFLNLKK